MREHIGDNEYAPVINIVSKAKSPMNELTVANDVCLLPPNCADVLQWIDLSMNKSAKALKRKFKL